MNVPINRNICTVLVVGMYVLLAAVATSGQTTETAVDGSTPLGLAPGAPAGSYALSNLDNINLYNGGLNFTLPIVKIAGRGGAGYTTTVRIEQKWIVHKEQELGEPNRYYADESWWNGEVMFSMGQLAVRHGVKNVYYNSCGAFIPRETLTRLTFTAPDGTEYELRDQLTGGRPDYPTCPVEFNRGRIFTTADGTSAMFISDADIIDSHYGAETQPSGSLLLRDGTRFRIDAGLVSWMRDRNGNKVTFTYDVFRRVTAVTDSLNRQVTVSYGEMYGYDQITVKGFGGAARTIKLYRLALRDVLRSDFTEMTPMQLFPELDGGGAGASRPVISAVELPNGQKYQFYYNPYGELARVVLPTGGASEYDWAAGTTDGPASGVISITGNKQVYRRVVERRIYPDGGTGTAYATRMTYSRPETSTTNLGYVVVDQYNSTGTLLSRSNHYFYGSARASVFQIPTQYPGWKDGREYQTVSFAGNGTTPLRQVNHTFAQRAAVSWWTGDPDLEPPNDPRLVETTSTLPDTNQVSKQVFDYDDSVPFNNQNNVKEYDFGSGAPGGLKRETRTTFVTASSYTDASTGAYLLSLASQVSVFDGSGVERARTTTEFDNYTATANHAALVNRTSISGFDASFTTSYTTRGNVTATTHYLLTNGAVSGSVAGYAQYDIAGNVVKAIDARGYATTFSFSDCFGAPNAEARLNSAPLELSAQAKVSYAFPTLVTNALGHTTYTQRDYYTAQAVDAEDANGVTSSAYHDDDLDRPTQVIRAADDTALRSQTSFSYDDTNRFITTTSDFDSFNDPTPLKSQTLYDGLGRTTETRNYETATTYVTTRQTYDALGRVDKVSNPYRAGQTVVWTTTTYDALGRVTSLKTPDNAVVATSYSGNTVTATDQSGKKRKSVTDALGRLTQIYEDPTTLNYLTSYSYDVLDNLTTVTQGVQTRTFTYDSLKRLKSAANPESGTINYTYDNNGNLLTKTDARSITTTFTYDALNRPTLKNYGDTTPDVRYFYDAQTLPAGAPSFVRGSSTGRLVAVTTGGTSAGSYYGYDAVGQTLRRIQQTDSVNYLVDATYNKAGAMATETYPTVPGASGRRTVSYTFDTAGRLSALSSAATTYAPAASVSSISYAAHGALASETLGNNLIHAQTYNNRLQPTQIKLGTAAAPTSVLNLTYNYGTTTNNGNVLSMTYAGGGLSYTQNFGYDQLNRLTTSQEGAAWSQTNSYDRYGNRSIVGGLTFNAANNRISTAGHVYDAAGNLTNDTLHTYTFDAENKISKVDNVVAYSYNGEGQRVRKLVGENTRFIYGIGGQLVAEFDGTTANLKKEYVQAGATLITIEPTAVNANGTRYTTSDHLGSPRVVTNSSAGVVSRHDYMPFGIEIGVTVGGRTSGMGYGATDNVRQKFTQKERDSETGLDYFLARYYSSTQGRFTSPDEFTGGPDELYTFVDDASDNPTFYADLGNPQSLNKYQYAYNNPLRYVDPDGHCPTCEVIKVGTTVATVAPVPVPVKVGAAVVVVGAVAYMYRDEIKAGAKAAFDWARTGNTEADASCPACGSSERMGQALMERRDDSHKQGNKGINKQGQVSGEGEGGLGPGNKPENKGSKPKKERSAQGAQTQREDISAAQAAKRKRGQGAGMENIDKSKQDERTELRKVKDQKDSEDKYRP